ncbi:hypothetical protein TNCV_1431181 [Trichonephila clavipes]|nr:hypothetical protein TNCV_1431181 [Trichonephila clavipes]
MYTIRRNPFKKIKAGLVPHSDVKTEQKFGFLILMSMTPVEAIPASLQEKMGYVSSDVGCLPSRKNMQRFYADHRDWKA